MTTTLTEQRVELLAIDKLDGHPKNPHGKLSEKDPKVQELKAQIEAAGQKVPCLVRPKGDRYEIVLGHRRTFVAGLLGKTEVGCLVEELADDMTDLLVLQENASHAPPNPFLEAKLVGELLKRQGWTMKSVATHMGKTIPWVAQRANLVNLRPAVKAIAEKNEWPVEWSLDVARLAPDVQDELASKKDDWGSFKGVEDQHDLDRLLGQKFQVLEKATWKLDDATLCPKAGACTTCPKTSLASPGLFDDGEVDAQDAKAVKKAICRDKACWDAKGEAVVKARIAEAKKEAGAGAVVVADGYNVQVPAGVPAKKFHDVSPAKESDKDAKPAVFLDDKGQVKTGFVKPKKSRGAEAKPKVDPAKAPRKGEDFAARLAASKKDMAARRRALLKEKREKALADAPVPDQLVLGGLLLAFGAQGPPYQAGPKGKRESELERRKKLFDLASNSEAERKELWPRIVECVEEETRYAHDEETELLGVWVAELLGITEEKLNAAVMKALPDPAWWWGKAPPATDNPKKKGK